MTKRASRQKEESCSWRWRLPFERAAVYLIALFVFVLPLFIWPGVTEYGYGKTILALIGVSILLILWAGSSWLRGEWRLRLPWLTFPVLGLAVVSLLSLLGATNGGVVVQSLALLIFFSLFALVVANVVKEERDVTLILYVLLLSAFFASLYGLLQYLGVMRGARGIPGLGEIISTVGNRNYLGGFLAYLLIPSVILIVRLRSWVSRVVALALLGFNVAMVLLVQQTGTIIGLVVGVAVLALGLGLWPALSSVRQRRAWLAGLGAICLVVIGLLLGPMRIGIALLVVGIVGGGFFGLGWALRRWRWTWVAAIAGCLALIFLLIPPTTPFEVVKQTWARNADAVRAWDWWVGWEMFTDSPFVGVGLGNYKLNFLPYKATFLASPQGAGYNYPGFVIARAAQAHSEYVQVIAELGALGVLASLALLVMIPITFWRRLRHSVDEGDRFDLIFLGSGVVVFLVHALVSFPAHLPTSSLVLVLVLGLACSHAYGKAASVSVRLQGWPHKVVVGVLIAFCLAVSVVAARDYSADRLLNRGIRQLQLGQVRLAEEMLAESARRDFCPRQVYYHLATAKIQQGRYEEAKADFDRCLTRYVVEPVYLNLTNLAVNLGEVETARETVELLLSTNPYPQIRVQAKFLRGIIAVREGDLSRAVEELEALARTNPDFERSYIALGDLYRARGMPVTARKWYEEALELIEATLSSARNRLSSVTTLPAEEYAKLRSDIQMLTQEKRAVEAGLAKLPPPVEIPEALSSSTYHLDDIRDVSINDCVRLIADVVLESSGALTDNQLIEIARQTINEIVVSKEVNAITVAFWRPENIVDKKSPAASVDWAPGGEWNRADTCSSGDYSRHAYRVIANNTARR